MAMFEYSEMDLQMELTTRSRQRVVFHETDVESIVTLLVDAVRELRGQRVRVNPRNIMIMPDKTLRLANPMLEENAVITMEGFHAPECANPNEQRTYEK